MTSLAALHSQHVALATLASSIDVCDLLDPPMAERLRRSLALFATRLAEHFAAEDQTLSQLCAAPQGTVVRLAGETRRREAETLAEACRTFSVTWTRIGRIEEDPRGFASGWGVLRAALFRLVAREEGEVYPLSAAGWSPKPVLAPPATGIRELDDDHAEVFALIGGLRAAVGGGSQIMDAASISTLAEYAERHFAREEALMVASRHPGLEDHRQEHHRARSILMGFRNDYLEGRKVEVSGVLLFLEGWMLSHISDADQELVRHLRATGRIPG